MHDITLFRNSIVQRRHVVTLHDLEHYLRSAVNLETNVRFRQQAEAAEMAKASQ